MPNTAYMLLYRKVTDESEIIETQPPEIFAAQFKAEAEKIIAQLLQDQQNALQIKLKVYFNGVLEIIDTMKDTTYDELLEQCKSVFKIEQSGD